MIPGYTSPSASALGLGLGPDLGNILGREKDDQDAIRRKRRMAALTGQSAAAKLLAGMGRLNLQ